MAVDGATIPPGGSVQVPVLADWTKRAGPQSASVALVTDDPNVPPLKLTVSGYVEVAAVVSPSSVNFDTLRPGETRARVVEVGGGDTTQDFEVVGATSSDPRLTVRRAAGDGPAGALPVAGGPGRFEVAFTGGRTARQESATVTFKTNVPDHPEVTLSVTAKSLGPITVSPDSLYFADGVDERELTVDVAAGSPGAGLRAHITGAAAGTEAGTAAGPFTIRRQATDGPGRHKLVISLDRGRMGRAVARGGLTLEVGDDSIEVPLGGVAGPPP